MKGFTSLQNSAASWGPNLLGESVGDSSHYKPPQCLICVYDCNLILTKQWSCRKPFKEDLHFHGKIYPKGMIFVMGKFPSRAMGGKVCLRPHTQVAISFSSEQGKASGGGGGREREGKRGEKQGRRGKGVPGAEVLATSLGKESIMTKTLRENPQELRSLQGQQRTGPQSIYGSLKGLVNIYTTVGKFPRRSQSSAN